MRARDCGFEVVYQGIRLTPAQIVAAAVEEDVHVVGLSILSGSHMEAVPAVLRGLREAGAGDVPVVVGGIIPDGDAALLREQGVAAVFTPKDFELTEILREVAEVVRAANGLRAEPSVAPAAASPGRAAGVAGGGRQRAADLRVARRHPAADDLEDAAGERQQHGEQRPRAQAAGEEGPDHGPVVPRRRAVKRRAGGVTAARGRPIRTSTPGDHSTCGGPTGAGSPAATTRSS